MFPSYDIIWVMDPSLIHNVSDTKCRLLVWDRVACSDESVLMAEIAMFVIYNGIKQLVYGHLSSVELDRQVAIELGEEVSEILAALAY